MEPFERELYDHVSGQLMEFIWRAHYPINPGIGIWGFIEGFRVNGFDAQCDGTKAVLTAGRMLGEKSYLLRAELKRQEIVDGWGWSTPGSPRSLYDSICEVYDRIGKNLESREEKNIWSEIRNTQSRTVRQSMEDSLEVFIGKYQEHVLLPAKGDVPKAEEPRLFAKVLAEFPMHLYEFAKRNTTEVHLGPDAKEILDVDVSEFDESYHPSAWALRELFWGQYLDALAREKGYVADKPSKSRLKSFISAGSESDALPRAEKFWTPARSRKSA